MPDKKSELDALLDRWHADHFAGSPVARDTQCWNLVHAATQDLKARLAARDGSATADMDDHATQEGKNV